MEEARYMWKKKGRKDEDDNGNGCKISISEQSKTKTQHVEALKAYLLPLESSLVLSPPQRT